MGLVCRVRQPIVRLSFHCGGSDFCREWGWLFGRGEMFELGNSGLMKMRGGR